MKENNPLTNNNEIKTIHTYSSDMAEAVRDNNVSVIKIALAEQKKRSNEIHFQKSEISPLSKFFFFFGAIIILLLAVGAIYYVSHKQKQNATVPISTSANNSVIIPFSEALAVDISSRASFSEVAQEIRNKIPTTLNRGGILLITLVRSTIGTTEQIPLENFVSFIPITAPDSLARSLDTNYMLAYSQSVDKKKAPHPFIIFKTKDYNQTYAGMLKWENTIASDFGQLFHSDIESYSSSVQGLPWRDVFIQNNNARVLYDDKRTALLYYVFVNNTYLIISDDKDTIDTIYPILLLKKRS